MQIKAIGYRADPRNGSDAYRRPKCFVRFCFAEEHRCAGAISPFISPSSSCPRAKGKDLILAHCSVCHAFQTRMAAVRRDVDGWKDRVAYMQDAMHFSIFLGAHLTDQDADEMATYLTSVFGPDSIAAEIAGRHAGLQRTVRPFNGDAMNIVYVEYDMPAPSRMPFSAAPDKDGYLWIPDFGVANKITRLDPKTGAMTDFPRPM